MKNSYPQVLNENSNEVVSIHPTPVTLPINLMMKNDSITKTNPNTAKAIVFLAWSSFLGSPPETKNRIPPMIITITAIDPDSKIPQ